MTARPVAVYVHWPWCKSKCPYCDFNSHVEPQVDHARWQKALLAELARLASDGGTGPVSSIFFGGGTPSLMTPAVVAALIEKADNLWGFADGFEITLEANPGDLDRDHLRALKSAGVNRLSIGVQSFDDAQLRFLGRRHDAHQARQAARLARETFDNLSLDLIYAVPGQTADHWRDQMDQALDFRPDHLSAYQLTIEKGTPFHRDRVPEAPEDLGEVLFDLTADHLAAAGWPAYEISNHAQPGRQCRHNLFIWRGGDYLGVGPGAHGRITRNGITRATYQWADPGRWLAEVDKGNGDRAVTPLSATERREELVMLGLRLVEGLDAAHFQALTGSTLDAAVNRRALRDLVDEDLLIQDGPALRCTPRGRKLLNGVIAALLTADF